MSDKIKAARKAAGFTQKQMSIELGIPRRTIENWEAKKNKCPEWAERLVIAELHRQATRLTADNMKTSRTWENIGWGVADNCKMELVNHWTPSNDYDYSEFYVDGNFVFANTSERETIARGAEKHFGIDWQSAFELADWLLRR